MAIWPFLLFHFNCLSSNKSKCDRFAREIWFSGSFWLNFEGKTDPKELRSRLKSCFWCHFHSILKENTHKTVKIAMEIWPFLLFRFNFLNSKRLKWDGFAREIWLLVSFWLNFEGKTDPKESRLPLKSGFWCYFGSDSRQKKTWFPIGNVFFICIFQHFFELFFDNFGFGKIRFHGRKQCKTWSFVVKKRKSVRIACSMGILMKSRFSGKYAQNRNRPKS